ncbi:FMN-linked oxidoreductase [Stipitochalara longipes BDJ]|nr:FMN-linked oxidoreductase [Stipitochalara longipes BDJ]
MSPEDDIILASEEWSECVYSGAAHRWEHLELLQKHWDGPIVLKGIQHPEDVKLAIEHGMQGVMISNHGDMSDNLDCRQLDGAVGSLEMLPKIVEAVDGKITVLFDSGIRTGADIIKALCLGVDAVLVGRPAIYGLGIAGKMSENGNLPILVTGCL